MWMRLQWNYCSVNDHPRLIHLPPRHLPSGTRDEILFSSAFERFGVTRAAAIADDRVVLLIGRQMKNALAIFRLTFAFDHRLTGQWFLAHVDQHA